MQKPIEISTIFILVLFIVGPLSILLALLSKDRIKNRLGKHETGEDLINLPNYLLIHPELGFLGIPVLFLSGYSELLLAVLLMIEGDIPQLLAIGFVVFSSFIVVGTFQLYREVKAMLV
ncbi:MAG: hypothetical protein GF411_09275 [Candidatus Lokiarchaeota archaeon]|nr:hypothetical protein [Candidatus Lokiarchaeota archaeon]